MFNLFRKKPVTSILLGSALGMVLGIAFTIWATPYIIGFIWNIAK